MTITGMLFAVAFLVAMWMTLFRNPLYGLYAYLAVFYLHPPSRWWGAFLPDVRWSFVAAGLTVLAIWLRAPRDPLRKSWAATGPAIIMILFVAWFWITGLWALDAKQHYPAGFLILKYVVVFYMIYRLIDTPEKVTTFLLIHVAGCLYLGLLAYGAPQGGRLDGVGGPGIDDSNTLGMHLATGVVTAAALILHLRGWRWLFCVVAIVFSLNGIVLTGSRGAFVALASGGIALTVLRPAAYRRLFYGYAVLGILAIGYVASDQYWTRVNTVTAVMSENEEEVDNSVQSRLAMMKAQLTMASLYPLGTGHRGSEFLSPRYLDEIYLTQGGARSSHNVLLTVLVEQGIPGVVLFFAMLTNVALALRKLSHANLASDRVAAAVNTAAIGAALSVVLIGGMFADFSKCEVQIWMFALLASLSQALEATLGSGSYNTLRGQLASNQSHGNNGKRCSA